MRDARVKPYIRMAAILSGLLLPTLTLIPLGSLWLWQNGYLLHWALATAALVGTAYYLARRRLFQLVEPSENMPDEVGGQSSSDLKEASWTPAEEQAWEEVIGIARRVDVKQLTSREAVLGLGVDTVRAVAGRLHPEVTEPVWQFTVPEALAIVERVSRRLGAFSADYIPFGDRLTVAHLMALYRWRGTIDAAERAYNVWRLLRLINPMTAVTHELRERLSKQMVEWGRAHVTQRLAYAYVTEVGRAAIDLYGGRLRVSTQQLESEVSAASQSDKAEISGRIAEPLRILIAGQKGVGKSSLLNALAAEVHAAVDVLPATSGFTAYELRRAGFPSAHLIDSPGLGATNADRNELISKATDADLVLWVVPGHRADRDIDQRAIAALREKFATLPNRLRPPILLVLTYIDQLRPFQEWSPPYDLGSTIQPKAASIRAAFDDVAKELGFAESDVVPVSLVLGASYNIDALWARILMALPEAQRAMLVRRLHDAKSDWNWRKVWSQATGAGRVLGRALTG